jgi:hypothetical protein
MSVRITAVAQPIEYHISYELNGGTQENQKLTYTVES